MSTTNISQDDIRRYFDGIGAALSETNEKALAGIADALLEAHLRGATVFTAGSEGGAAAAARTAGDLTKRCAVLGRAGIRTVCLSDSASQLTCLAKDCSYDDVYAVELSTLARRGDVLCLFSADGNAAPVVRAAEYAHSYGLTVIGFLGGDGGAVLPLCDYRICVPGSTMETVEDIHMICEHALVGALQDKLKDAWGLEVIFPPVPGRKFKFALFDFDGTLSLIREGWQKVMIPYFCEEIFKTPVGKTEDPKAVETCVTEFVDLLTGKQTIYQCIRLAEEVEKRGGKPEDPMAYKTEYLRRLMEKIKDRREGLANGTIDPEALLVRGSEALLKALKREGVTMYLASGTDQPQVREEAALLGLDKYFDGNIYGALDEHVTSCTKELVIKRLLAENGRDGTELLSFGDGFVEIELVSNLGGYPIAVATDESRKMGIDTWKRDRLVKAGAGAVIPDFECAERLVDFILGR